MGKKGKKNKAGKVSKGDRKRVIADLERRLAALVDRLEDELKDVDLLAPPPPNDDCDICMVPLPLEQNEWKANMCCGKFVCGGCAWKHMQLSKAATGVITCPFCRDVAPRSPEEYIRGMEARAEKDAEFTAVLGKEFARGAHGFPRDELKSLQLFCKASELGRAESLVDISIAYHEGTILKKDLDMTRRFNEAAVKMGSRTARANLGCDYYDNGNIDLAKRHWMVGASAGSQACLDKVKSGLFIGHVTKDEYEQVLRSKHEAFVRTRTDERDDWLAKGKPSFVQNTA